MMCSRWSRKVACPAVLAMSAGLFGGWVQPSGQQPPLGGPPVQERNVPGVNGQFGDGRDRKGGEPEIPHRVYMKAIADALGDGAAMDVKASPEQMEKIRAIEQGYNESVRKYMEENKGQMEGARRLLEQRGKGKGPGVTKPGDEADPMETPEQAKQREEMMEKARQFRENMPKPGDVHTKIWETLSEPQQKAVQVELDKFREQQKKQREDAYVRQKMNKKAPVTQPGEVNGQPQPPGKRPLKGATPDAAGPGADNGGAAMTPERRERLMKLFERMTPEQQDELLKRLEERLNNGGGKGRPPTKEPPPSPPK